MNPEKLKRIIIEDTDNLLKLKTESVEEYNNKKDTYKKELKQ